MNRLLSTILLLIFCTLASSADVKIPVTIKLTKRVKYKKHIRKYFKKLSDRSDVIEFRFTKSYREADVFTRVSNQYGHAGWHHPGSKTIWINKKIFDNKKSPILVIFHEICHVYKIPHSDNPNSVMAVQFDPDREILDSDLKELEIAVTKLSK